MRNGLALLSLQRQKPKSRIRSKRKNVPSEKTENTSCKKKLESIGAVLSTQNMEELCQFYKIHSTLDLLVDIARKKIDLKELKQFTVAGDRIIAPKPKAPEPKPEYDPTIKEKKDTELIIFGESSDNIMYSLANCCKPIPGDNVFGFVSSGEGLKNSQG